MSIEIEREADGSIRITCGENVVIVPGPNTTYPTTNQGKSIGKEGKAPKDQSLPPFEPVSPPGFMSLIVTTKAALASIGPGGYSGLLATKRAIDAYERRESIVMPLSWRDTSEGFADILGIRVKVESVEVPIEEHLLLKPYRVFDDVALLTWVEPDRNE